MSRIGRGGVAVLLAATLLAAAVAYRPALGGGFLLEDEDSVLQNPRAHGVVAWLHEAGSRPVGLFRPLTELTYAVDAERGGLAPRPFHETGVALHLATAAILFAVGAAVARRAGFRGGRWLALAAAAGFALHPVQAQVVASVSQRAEALAALCSAASLAALLAADATRRRTLALLLGGVALVLHAFALAAKPSAVIVPVLFLLACAAAAQSAGDRPPPRGVRRAYLVAPLLALSILDGASVLLALGDRTDAGFAVPGLGPWRYLLTQARVIPGYLALLVRPGALSAEHDVVPSAGLLAPASTLAGAVAVIALALAAAGALVWARRKPREYPGAPSLRVAGLGVLWFLVALAPTSSLLPLAEPAAEPRLYLAVWGAAAAVAALAGLAARALPPRARVPALALAGAAAGLTLAGQLRGRAELWGNPVALWRDAAGKSPGKPRVHVNLGAELARAGDLDGALAAFRHALSLGGATLPPLAAQSSAARLVAAGRLAEAREVLSLQEPPEPETLVLRAQLELDAGRPAEAEAWASRALAAAPGYGRAWEISARVSLAQGDLLGARSAVRRAVALAVPEAGPLLELASLAARAGAAEVACDAWRRAARAPGDADSARRATGEATRARCR
jgi:tetratricopeptide (TPR) repeat protein